MDLTCLTNYPSIPSVPKLANDSNIFVHQTYNPASGGLTQLISASLARSTFSINDVRYLIDRIFVENGKSWSSSEVVKINPIPSIIIYSSIALALFIILSIIFCAISCCCCSNKHHQRRRQLSKRNKVCLILLILVYLLGIGDMIYVAYRVNKAKVSIDDAIKTTNRDIYPRAIAEHVEYLTKQLDHLDRYTIKDNSILMKASRSMLVQIFDQIFTNKYFLRDIAETINSVNKHFQELDIEVNNQSALLSSHVIEIFNDSNVERQSLLTSIQKPVEELCKYTNGTQMDIDQKLLNALDIVHTELNHVNQTIRNDILSKITPWDKNMLLDMKLEEDIRKYINIGGIIFLILVILLGVIPLVFLCLILICRICGCCQTESDRDQVYKINSTDRSFDDDFDKNPYSPYREQHRKKKSGTRSKKCRTPGTVLCLIRIAFFVMIIFLLLLVLLTAVSYALDHAIQGSCRSLHDDQPHLVNVVAEQLIKSNVVFGNSVEMNKTISNIINDCGNQIHFSRKFLDNYWLNLTSSVESMIDTLNKRIYDAFIQSIKDIDIAADLQLLMEFDNATNDSNILSIVAKIREDFITLESQFINISSSNSTLSQSLIQPTIDQYQNYTKTVLESTIDACPLPLVTISETDELLCHTLGGSISGLWLSIFIFLTLITLGCCIFGICVYKRLNIFRGSISSTSSMESLSAVRF